MISREKLQELVEVWYRPTFKTFYVNSLDGKTFVKPFGVFVSLGMVTSKKVLEDIRDLINDSYGYNAVLAEISSREYKSQHINLITNLKDPEQYELPTNSPNLLNREEALEELSRLNELLIPTEDLDTLKETAPKLGHLKKHFDRIESAGSWDRYLIERCSEPCGYRIFHKYVNCIELGDIKYRLGIYVTEDSDYEDKTNLFD